MWPSTLLTLFEAVKWDSGDENDLLGPYNALLDFCFPWEEGWIVVPQFRRPSKIGTLDFVSVFVVFHQKTPRFFLEIKPACHSDSIASRAAADEQMRDMSVLLSGAQTPMLHGVSALGPRMSQYKLDTSTCELSPYQIPRHPYHGHCSSSSLEYRHIAKGGAQSVPRSCSECQGHPGCTNTMQQSLSNPGQCLLLCLR